VTYKLTVERYNNKDFRSELFYPTSEEAWKVAEKLKALKHITRVVVESVEEAPQEALAL